GRAAGRALWLRYRLIAAELAVLGIDGNCAPVADIAGPRTHPFLRNRCYATTAAAVAARARAVADGLLAGGVLPVVKHIPGHGRARTDSHVNLPRVAAGAAALRATDFAPFAALADLPMAMTAHVVYRALDPARPATTSPRVIGLIRREIGFDGLLMTDDLSMNALQGPVGGRTRAALAAGCDIALHCNGDLAEMRAVAEAAGGLDGLALRRADAALAMRRAADPVDTAALEAELDGLTGGQEADGAGR
ncbi:beta-hexosaminidase, partial [Rhodobacteraceae bacterium WD3A24]